MSWERDSGCLSSTRWALLTFVVLMQCLSFWITWPLWEVRQSPVHLPLIDLPQIPFGAMLCATACFALWQPRAGLVLHVVVLLTSFVFDQYRTQPQFIALAVLMFAVIEEEGATFARWFLVSLWFWAGLHKLISPMWYGESTWYMVRSVGLDPGHFQIWFVLGVAWTEMLLGGLAIVRPRAAAGLCVMVHVGICVFLSPLFYNHNVSVIPWNLTTAVVGAWVLGNTVDALPRFRWEWCLAVVMLVYPMGVYVGVVDHGIASVLYSEGYPEGTIYDREGAHKIVGWSMAVPFPNERRLLRQYFERSASPGAFLHVDDPRAWLPDEYVAKLASGEVVSISYETFVIGVQSLKGE